MVNLDKSSSFAVEQDSITGNWRLDCSAEVQGIDQTLDHSVGLFLQAAGTSGTVTIFSGPPLTVSGPGRIKYSEANTDIVVTKTGNRLVVSLLSTDYYPAVTGDRFICTISIGREDGGNQETLYSVRMEQRLQDIGTP